MAWVKGKVVQLRTSSETETSTKKSVFCNESKTVTRTWYHLLFEQEDGVLRPLAAPGSSDPNLALLLEGDVITVNVYSNGAKQNFCQMTIHFAERARFKK